MNRKIRVLLTLLLLLLAAGLIFGMSAQPAPRSNSMSLRLARRLTSLLFPSYGEMSPAVRFELLSAVNRLVRKFAHWAEYAFLGTALILHLRALLPEGRLCPAAALSLAFGVLFAALDEYHQSFVAGRGMLLGDVLIDSFGLLCGVLWVLSVVGLLSLRCLGGGEDPGTSR